MTERRVNQRFEVELPAEILCLDRDFHVSCVVKNISKGGALVASGPGLKLGERVEIQLETGMVFIGDLLRGSKAGNQQPGFSVEFVRKGALIRDGKALFLQTGCG